MYIRKSIYEKVFDVFSSILMIILMVLTLYPLLYVAFASVSDPSSFIRHTGLLLGPKGFTLSGYKAVLENPMIAIGYYNTIIYVVAGTALSVVLTAMGAYVLSRKGLYWKNTIMFVIVFTMFFSGGLIPGYLVVMNLGILDSRLAIILPTAISTWNLIIMRTYFTTIPDSMEESAVIDGANDFIILFFIVLPLALPIVAVMILFYGVGNWNAWFGAMIYLQDRSLYPLQLVLREIILINDTASMTGDVAGADKAPISEIIKYATIMVATVPILFIYPFLQKYFVKGVMVGALKE